MPDSRQMSKQHLATDLKVRVPLEPAVSPAMHHCYHCLMHTDWDPNSRNDLRNPQVKLERSKWRRTQLPEMQINYNS